MTDFRYNILWIDDQHEKLDSIKRAAIDYNIKFHAFKSLTGGLDELENNYKNFDGVLLDAKFYEYENDAAGSEDTYNSIEAKERISQLPKKFDIHVLTGQSEAYGNKTYKKFFKKVFRKGVDEDEDALFESLKNSAENQKDNQLKAQFKPVFELCDEKYLGKKIEDRLLGIARLLQKEDENPINTSYINEIRKVIEALIKKLATYNLIPSEIANNKGWINGSGKFISKRHQMYEQTQEYYHPFFAHIFEKLLSVIQDGSHSEGTLTLKVDDYINTSNQDYVIKSCIYELFEILSYSKSLIDHYPDKESNKSFWKQKNSKSGTVINFNIEKGFAFFKPDDHTENIFIPHYLVSQKNLKEGDKIKAISENFTDRKTGARKARVSYLELE